MLDVIIIIMVLIKVIKIKKKSKLQSSAFETRNKKETMSLWPYYDKDHEAAS